MDAKRPTAKMIPMMTTDRNAISAKIENQQVAAESEELSNASGELFKQKPLEMRRFIPT
jgi:hypothetical protein